VDSNGYLTRKGDIIISADGKEIEKPSDLTKQVEAKKPGDPITLGININGNVVFKAVRLGSLPGY
jgi:S1-C subfamily serine protease